MFTREQLENMVDRWRKIGEYVAVEDDRFTGFKDVDRKKKAEVIVEKINNLLDKPPTRLEAELKAWKSIYSEAKPLVQLLRKRNKQNICDGARFYMDEARALSDPENYDDVIKVNLAVRGNHTIPFASAIPKVDDYEVIVRHKVTGEVVEVDVISRNDYSYFEG